jgi:hypothetical protein
MDHGSTCEMGSENANLTPKIGGWFSSNRVIFQGYRRSLLLQHRSREQTLYNLGNPKIFTYPEGTISISQRFLEPIDLQISAESES